MESCRSRSIPRNFQSIRTCKLQFVPRISSVTHVRIKQHQATDYPTRLIETLTTIRSVNKNDAVSLVTNVLLPLSHHLSYPSSSAPYPVHSLHPPPKSPPSGVGAPKSSNASKEP